MPAALPVLRALADPTRLRIVALVRAVELSVGELAEVLDQSQPRVSRHVKILAVVGLINRFKEGAWVFLRLGTAPHVEPLLAALDAMTPDEAALAADRARLETVRAERAAASSAWFAEHAAEWDELRALHIADEAVEEALLRALGGERVGRLLDIGTGTGRMVELLGASAASAIGVDRSPEMLRLARARLDAAGLSQAEVRLGDMAALPFPPAAFDTVVLHHVLHFAADPALALGEAARVLAPGGRIAVVDFAPHDREELRTHHAHARLGFPDEAVLEPLCAAGLAGEVAARLSGGPLTVTVWLARAPALTLRRAA